MQMLSGELLSSDDTCVRVLVTALTRSRFKIIKLAIQDGNRVCFSLLVVMNEKNQVISWRFVPSKSSQHLQEVARELRQRFLAHHRPVSA
jgi:hypothetical protein